MKNNYNTCDIWVRFLAIDNYYKKNNDGFQIYNEVQHYRVNYKKIIPREQYDNEVASQNLFLFSCVCVLAIFQVHEFDVLFLHQISHHKFLAQVLVLVHALEF